MCEAAFSESGRRSTESLDDEARLQSELESCPKLTFILQVPSVPITTLVTLAQHRTCTAKLKKPSKMYRANIVSTVYLGENQVLASGPN